MFRKHEVYRIEKESETIKSFYFRSEANDSPDYLPGQFLNLRLTGADGLPFYRSYTISDAPGKGYYRISVKREDHGRASRFLHDELKVGDRVEVSNPGGNFHIDPSSMTPVVLLSGGIGITPMLSMLEYLQVHQPQRKVCFLHSSVNRKVQPMPLRLRVLESLNKNLFLSIHHTRPLDDETLGKDCHQFGIIKKGHLESTLLPYPVDYYLCGPAGFMKTMYGHLTALGILPEYIHYEFFGGSETLEGTPELKGSESPSYMVSFVKSQIEAAWDRSHTDLLSFAESLDLKPEHSCRMGTCSTCAAPLISGSVLYEPQPFLEAEEGEIFICCAQPTSHIKLGL